MNNAEQLVRKAAHDYFLTIKDRFEVTNEGLEDMILDNVICLISEYVPHNKDFRDDSAGIYVFDEFISYNDVLKISLEVCDKQNILDEIIKNEIQPMLNVFGIHLTEDGAYTLGQNNNII